MFLCDNQWRFLTISILNFEADFLENEELFQKLEDRFLVERTKVENISFPYKTAILRQIKH